MKSIVDFKISFEPTVDAKKSKAERRTSGPKSKVCSKGELKLATECGLFLKSALIFPLTLSRSLDLISGLDPPVMVFVRVRLNVRTRVD